MDEGRRGLSINAELAPARTLEATKIFDFVLDIL